MSTSRDLQAKQRARILDLISEGQVAGLCDADGNVLSYANRDKGILLELTPIRNQDGSRAFADVATDFRPGTAGQKSITGFATTEQVVGVEEEVTHGSDTWTNAVQRQIADGSHNAVRVSLRVPSLYEYDDDGNRNGSTIQFSIQIKRSADSTWKTVVGTNADGSGAYDGKIQGECMTPYVRSYRIPLFGTGPWDLRIGRITADSTDVSKLQNALWWESYTLLTDAKLAYRHSCVAAVEFDAEFQQRIMSRAYRMKGKLVKLPSNYNPTTRKYTGTWNGNFAGCAITLTSAYTAKSSTMSVSALATALPDNSPISISHGTNISEAYLLGDHAAGATSITITPIPRNIPNGSSGWGYKLQWTDNPAWIWYDVATNKRYGTGDYIPADSIDKWALYSIGRYCDGVDSSGNFVGVDDGKGTGTKEPRFTCSVYIASAADAYKLLTDLASIFRGMIYWGTGFITAAQDAPKAPQFSFTNANVIEGNFNYSSSARKARHTVVNVQWNDPADYYRPKVEQVEGDAEDIRRFGYRPTTVAAIGCTSRGQAQRVGRWILITEKYETETVTFRTGMEGARCRPGAIIRIRDRFKTQNRMGGRVKSKGSGTIELDAPVTISGSGWSLVVTKTDGTFAELNVTNSSGTYTTVTVTGSMSGVTENAVWILRRSTLEPTLWRILNVKEIEPNIFEVTGLQYVEGKFAAVETGVAVKEPRTSDLPPVSAPVAPASITITETTKRAAEKITRQLNVTWSKSSGGNIKGYKVEMREPGKEWRTLQSLTTSLSIKPVTVSQIGEYAFRVTTIGYYNLKSSPKVATYTLGSVPAPVNPTGFAVTGVAGGFRLSWNNTLDSDGVYEIYMSENTTRPSDPSETVSAGTTKKNLLGFVGGVTRYFWIRAKLSRKNIASGYVGPSSATTVDPTAKLVVLTASAQVFKVSKSGSVSPSSITLSATGQNLSGSPTWSVESGTATLTGTGSSRTLTNANLTTDACTIKVVWDGQEDFISIVRATDGSDAVVPFLTNESHTVAAAADGTVSSFAGAVTDMKVFIGATDDSANWSYSATTTNLSGSFGTGATKNRYTVSAMTADTAYVDITATKSGYTSQTKRFTVSKSRTGANGLDGLGALPASFAPGMIGGSGDVILIPNATTSAANDAEINIRGTKLYHPDGNERAVGASGTGKNIYTNFGEGSSGKFWVMWSDEDVTTRFSGFSTSSTNLFNKACAIVYEGGQWKAVDNAGTRFAFTPEATDCLIAYGEAAATSGGITAFNVWLARAGQDGGNANSWWLAQMNAIKKSESGDYTPSTFVASAFGATGATSPVPYSGRFIIATSTNGTSWTTRYTSASNESTASWTINLSNIVAIRVRLYLAGGTDTMVDEQIVPIVVDGSSAVTAYLTNDAAIIPTDSDGANGDYAEATTTMKIFIGAVDDSANWTYSRSNGSGVTSSINSSTGVLTVTAMSGDKGSVTITASKSGYSSQTKTFKLAKSKAGVNGSTILGSVAGGGGGASTNYTPLTPAISLTVSVDGQPKRIQLSGAQIINASGTTTKCYCAIYRSTTLIFELAGGQGVELASGQSFPIELTAISTPAAGSQTFSVRVKSDSGGSVVVNGTLSVS